MFRKMRESQSDQRMIDEQVVDTRVHELLSLFTPDASPNVHRLRSLANAIEPLAFNIKQMGYALARQLANALPPRGPTEARRVDLPSSLSTQAAIESDWVAHWCNELKVPVVYHRKIWELAFVLQSIYDRGHIRPGARGLGFGCGKRYHPISPRTMSRSWRPTRHLNRRSGRAGFIPASIRPRSSSASCRT